ncbi:MAG: hypothetical protein DYG86_05700 [Chloroflexi bacterium CFX2]|nr:hypothetical protein [Chloroflexi bacterium CFX2]
MVEHKYLVFLTLVVLLTGCAKESIVTYTPPPLEEDWSVKMTLSGGFAGLRRNIRVYSDGNYTVADEKVNHTINGTLTENQLKQLEGMISTVEFTAPKIPSVCADCFNYDVEIVSGSRKLLFSVDDMSLNDSGVGDLVEFLRGLMDAALNRP